MIEFEKHDHISKNNPLYGEQLKMLEEVFYFRKERLELKNLTALSLYVEPKFIYEIIENSI